MRLLFFILFFVLILFSNALGQEAVQDSIWNLKDLDYEKYRKMKNEAMEEIRENKFEGFQESHGWFPKSTTGLYRIGVLGMGAGDNFDVADNIRSKAFTPATNPFSGNIFLESKEREIKKPNSQDIYQSESLYPIVGKLLESADFPKTTHGGFNLEFYYSPDFPLNISSKLMINQTMGLLFSEDNGKSYLNYKGKPTNFTEANIVHLNEWFLQAGVEIELPIYGAFIKTNNSVMSSYYYISAGPSINYVVWSDAIQYLQIADAKKDLRYDNGQDTLRLQSEVVLKGLNRIRYGIDISLGWKFNASYFGFGAELFTHIPISSVLEDATWKQYRFGFRWSFYYSNIFD